jgi:lipopolysaccharide export system permease protein
LQIRTAEMTEMLQIYRCLLPPDFRNFAKLKTLHKYLTLQILASLLLTVAVFTFVLLLGNVLRDILQLLIAGHARVGIVMEAVALLIPFVWVFALPMGMLTATLLVFGRFSADQELTAARASGISLLSLITPVLLLSLLCCALSAWFSMYLGPRSRVIYLDLRTELLTDLANMQLPEGRFINISANYTFYAEKNDHGKLENVMIQSVQPNLMMEAPRGDVEFHATNLVLNLYDVRSILMETNGDSAISSFGKFPISVNLDLAKKASSKPSISDMTFWQLQDELHELQQQLPQSISTNQTTATLSDIRKMPQNLIEQVRVNMHRQIAFSFASFGFALVGIPLAIRVHRRETNIGMALALVLAIVYFSFIILAQNLSLRPEFFPHLIIWVPNFLFQAVGAILLWRANRGI